MGRERVFFALGSEGTAERNSVFRGRSERGRSAEQERMEKEKMMNKWCWLGGLVLLCALGCDEEASSGEETPSEGTESRTGTEGTEGTEGEGTVEGDAVAPGTDGTSSSGEEGDESNFDCECTDSEDCTQGMICVGAGDAADSGVCSDYPPAGLCWTDEQCPFGATCEGVSFCPCELECFDHSPGTCGGGSGCCESAQDCIGGDVCANGVCKGLVGSKCWRDDDCSAGKECVGEVVCPCGSECVEADAMGSCLTAGLECCVSDLDCSFGKTCLESRCVDLPEAGSCWSASDCEGGNVCTGALTCGCDATCTALEPGVCENPLECCATDEECESGLVCLGGACRTALVEGTCWGNLDCGENEICTGSFACLCGQVCKAETPGICGETVGTKCCENDTQCVEGSCVAGVCKTPSEKGYCWTDGDCLETQTCVNANSCPCEAQCLVEDQEGECVDAVEMK